MKKLKMLAIGLFGSLALQAQISVDSIGIREIVTDLAVTPGGSIIHNRQFPVAHLYDEWLAVCGNPLGTSSRVGTFGFDSLIIESSGWTSYIRYTDTTTTTVIRDIEVDLGGNVYLVGSVRDSLIFSPTQKFQLGSEGLVLVKYSNTGSYLWHRYIAGATGMDIEFDGSNNPVVFGHFADGRLLARKYDPSGAQLAQLTTTISSGGLCFARRAAFDGTDFYITGGFHGTATFDSKTIYTSSEGMHISKVSADLSTVSWVDFSYSPGEGTWGWDVELDECNYPVGAGTWISGPTAQLWIYRYHPDGTWLGSYRFNGQAQHMEGFTMEMTGMPERIYVAGQFMDTLYGPLDTILATDTALYGYVASVDTCLLSATAHASRFTTSFSSDTVTLFGYPSGGIFSGPGVTGNAFDPAIAGPGQHTVAYTFSDCQCIASDSIVIDVKCYPEEETSEYLNIHEDFMQNYPHFKRKESDHFVDSIPDPETGNPVPVWRVISVATSPTTSGDIYVSLSTDGGKVLWTREFGGTARDRGTAVKKCTSGYAVTGTTRSFGTNYQKPFILRLNDDGSIRWFRVYEIDNHVLSVNIVELNNGDLALAGFYNPYEFAGQQHDFFTLVTDASGGMISFQQLGRANRDWEYIRDIEATQDGGFVIVGNTGHNGDYHGGTLIKFDATYNIQWATQVTRVLGGGVYNLGVPGQRSNVFFTSVKETSDGDYLVTGRVSDHDGSGQNATFRHGLVLRFSNPGHLVNQAVLAKNTNDFLILHNLVENHNGELVVVGKTKDPSGSLEYTCMIGLDPGMTSVLFAVEYDYEIKNEGLCIWQSPDRGYTMTGLTGPTGANKRHFVLKTDSLGISANASICDQPVVVTPYVMSLMDSTYLWQLSIPNHYDMGYTPDSLDLCVLLRDCSASGIPDGRMKTAWEPDYEYDNWLDVEPGQEDGATPNVAPQGITVYPNPAQDVVRFSQPVSRVRILDITGRMVWQASESVHTEVPVGQLQRGTYLIELTPVDGGASQVTQLVIE